MAYTIPPRPSTFSPAGVAPGCERVPNLYARDKMGRRVDVLVVHTNWAGGVATIQSAINWAKSNPGQNTYPHYQHERGGRAAKLLDTDRRGIGTGGVTSWWRDTHGLPNASYRTLTYETSDRGTNTDPAPTGSWFTDQQLVSLTRDLAYEAVVHDIPPVLLKAPEGRGIAGHCFPFPYPVFTTARGKLCPGYRKWEQLREVVIPWTAAIVNAWQNKPAPEPTKPPPTTDPTGTTLLAHGWYYVRAGDSPWSIAARVLRDGRRHPELTARVPGTWKPGQFIEIPDEPSVVLTVQAGEGWWSVLRRALPGEDPRVRLAAAYEWNGGPARVLRPNDVVSVPVRWRP